MNPVVEMQRLVGVTGTTPETGAAQGLWREACSNLSQGLVGDEPTSVVHDVEFAIVSDPLLGVHTEYRVRVNDAAHVPQFSLTKRTASRLSEVARTPEAFFSAVAIQTHDEVALLPFLTDERCELISELLMSSPSAKITNDCVYAWSNGVDLDQAVIERTIDQLIDVAEALRPTWADVALDEQAVLHDLFDTGRSAEDMTQRFADVYVGAGISWHGEVLEVGAVDRNVHPAMVLLGTADGRTLDSGRVVAVASIAAELDPTPGQVVAIDGALWHLDPGHRLFHII